MFLKSASQSYSETDLSLWGGVYMNCLAQCLPVDCTQGASFIIMVGLMVHHQGSALMVIGHLLGAKETGRENQLFLSTYSVPGLCLFSLFSFSSVQSLTRVWFFATPWTAACQASLSITDSRSLLRLPSIELVMPCNHLILCRPLLLSPLIFPSIRVFSDESVLRIRWPKYWCFSFNISPSNEYSGLVGSPCCPRDSQASSPIPQFKSINSSCSAFFIIYLLI